MRRLGGGCVGVVLGVHPLWHPVGESGDCQTGMQHCGGDHGNAADARRAVLVPGRAKAGWAGWSRVHTRESVCRGTGYPSAYILCTM